MDNKKAHDTAYEMAAGFWRRTAAFAIDSLLFGLVGLLVIAVGFRWLASIGGWGKLIGFVISSLYFVLLEGCNNPGQSPGKRVMKIKVVRLSPEGFSELTPAQTWIRYAVLGVPYVLGGLSFIDIAALRSPAVSWLVLANTLLMNVWLMVIAYLLVFNRPWRRSLHDLVLSTTVVRVEANAAGPGSVRGIHWVAMSVIGGMIAAGGIAFYHRGSTVQWTIETIPGIRQAEVTIAHPVDRKSESSSTVIAAVVGTLILPSHRAALSVARAALNASPGLTDEAAIIVIIQRGADLGIARWRTQFVESHSGSEWAQQIRASISE
ncbi:RDD family protein [Paraburkholderia sp. JHI869]|uniref:RDD family protein n=1 Tax=Paraburkholderia sp. JHI869 TaxID=3112959 RepID=UPI0031763683